MRGAPPKERHDPVLPPTAPQASIDTALAIRRSAAVLVAALVIGRSAAGGPPPATSPSRPPCLALAWRRLCARR